MSQPIKPKGRVLGAPKPSTPITDANPRTPTRTTRRNIAQDSPTPVTQDSTTTEQSQEQHEDLASPFIVTSPDIISPDPTPSQSAISSIAPSPLPMSDSKDNKNDSTNGDVDADLVCPICSEVMISLLQLNRHLDDEHLMLNNEQEVTPTSITTPNKSSPGPSSSFLNIQSSNEELRSWLKKGNDVRSKIQTVIPKKFVKLDIFENSNNFGILDSSSRDSSTSSLNTIPNEVLVTKKHWKKPRNNEICSFNGCKRQLSIKNGVVNCRKCGNLFCHEHTNFRVRLDANAQYDHTGVWSRCCEDCFINKPGYNDLGLFKDLTAQFKAKRQTKINERQLYENKLETRLLNLATRFAKIDREFKSNEFNSNLLTFRINSRKREVEQQIVQWEDEKGVLNCFICLKHYSFTLRKHHCRLCGRVVCGADESGCSKELPINVLTDLLTDLPKINDDSLVRLCRHCKDVLFLKRNFTKDVKSKLSPLLSKFESQLNLKKSILFLMPKFRDLILNLQSDKNLKNETIITEASKMRNRLLETFALFDKLTKEIIALDCKLDDEKRLQLSIQTESSLFIQQNMAPLKQLPKILKQIEEETKKLEAPKLTYHEVQEIKSKRETLMVLNEQKFLVDQMIDSCKKQRRYDEVEPLVENLAEITRQIEELQLQLGNEGFE